MDKKLAQTTIIAAFMDTQKRYSLRSSRTPYVLILSFRSWFPAEMEYGLSMICEDLRFGSFM